MKEDSITSYLKPVFRSWRFWRSFIAIVTGGIGGFLYYYFIGCNSGSCPITSNPYISIIWGGILGFLLINSFNTKTT